MSKPCLRFLVHGVAGALIGAAGAGCGDGDATTPALPAASPEAAATDPGTGSPDSPGALPESDPTNGSEPLPRASGLRPPFLISPIFTGPVTGLPVSLRAMASTAQDDDNCADTCWADWGACVEHAESGYRGCIDGCPGPDSDFHHDCRDGCLDLYRMEVLACNGELDSCLSGCAP